MLDQDWNVNRSALIFSLHLSPPLNVSKKESLRRYILRLNSIQVFMVISYMLETSYKKACRVLNNSQLNLPTQQLQTTLRNLYFIRSSLSFHLISSRNPIMSVTLPISSKASSQTSLPSSSSSASEPDNGAA